MRSISLSGVMGAGKTTLAEHFEFRYTLTRVAWGDAMKIEFFDAMRSGEMPSFIEKPDLLFPNIQSDQRKISWVDRHKPEVRTALQKYATEYRRAQEPDYWVKRGLARIDEFLKQGRTIVVDDTRFPDEVRALKSRGFIAAILDVLPEQQAERIMQRDSHFDPKSREHPSEHALDGWKFDSRIKNHTDLARLELLGTVLINTARFSIDRQAPAISLG